MTWESELWQPQEDISHSEKKIAPLPFTFQRVRTVLNAGIPSKCNTKEKTKWNGHFFYHQKCDYGNIKTRYRDRHLEKEFHSLHLQQDTRLQREFQ